MNEEKLKRFINDKTTSDSVYQFLLNSFLKDRPTQDVYVLAASRLAIDHLKRAWTEIERYKNSASEQPEQTNNPGV